MKLKNTIFRVLAALFTVAYLISLAGLDVHNCRGTRKTYVVFLSRSLDCSEIHPHNSCTHNCCHEHVSDLMIRLAEHHVRNAEGFNPGNCSCCHDESHIVTVTSDVRDEEQHDFNYTYVAQSIYFIFNSLSTNTTAAHTDIYNGMPGSVPDILKLNCTLRI